jgi:hypothetical protein
VTPTPGEACTEERQGGEQNKVARLGVHSPSTDGRWARILA